MTLDAVKSNSHAALRLYTRDLDFDVVGGFDRSVNIKLPKNSQHFQLVTNSS